MEVKHASHTSFVSKVSHVSYVDLFSCVNQGHSQTTIFHASIYSTILMQDASCSLMSASKFFYLVLLTGPPLNSGINCRRIVPVHTNWNVFSWNMWGRGCGGGLIARKNSSYCTQGKTDGWLKSEWECFTHTAHTPNIFVLFFDKRTNQPLEKMLNLSRWRLRHYVAFTSEVGMLSSFDVDKSANVHDRRFQICPNYSRQHFPRTYIFRTKITIS